jgi:hypothetical protein
VSRRVGPPAFRPPASSIDASPNNVRPGRPNGLPGRGFLRRPGLLRDRKEPDDQAIAGVAVSARLPNTSSAGLTRRRCQNPSPVRTSMTPPRAKEQMAAMRAI